MSEEDAESEDSDDGPAQDTPAQAEVQQDLLGDLFGTGGGNNIL